MYSRIFFAISLIPRASDRQPPRLREGAWVMITSHSTVLPSLFIDPASSDSAVRPWRRTSW
jgi:hypothetical protein